MARQQESRAGTAAGNFRWSPIAMIPAHLCVLVFLVFLLEKLEGSVDWPWAAVLSPLWITDAVFIIIKVRVDGRISSKRSLAEEGFGQNAVDIFARRHLVFRQNNFLDIGAGPSCLR